MIHLSLHQLKISLLLVFSFLSISTFAQETLYQHNFGTTFFGATANYTVPPSDNAIAINPSTSSWTSNAGTVTSSTTAASGRSLRVANSSGTKTLTLSFEVVNGYEIDITNFNFWRIRDASGAQNWSMTINGISVGSGTVLTTGASIGQTSVLNPVNGLSGTVTVVLTLTGASGTGGFNLDNFTLTGNSVNLNPTAIVEVFDNGLVNDTDIPAGSNNVLLGSYVVSVSQADARLEEFVAEISGDYSPNDIENFRLWISPSDIFNENTSVLIAENITNADGFEVFSVDELLLQDSSNYLFVTASISCEAQQGVSLKLKGSLQDYFLFSASTPVDFFEVNSNENGTLTIIESVISNVNALDVTLTNTTTAQVSWSNPEGCFDEVIIVVHTSQINGIPSGTYTASSLSYTNVNNPDFPGGGKVVYNGTISPQSVTNLTENQIYFIKVFVRNGNVWSDGVFVKIGSIVWNGTSWSNITGPTANDDATIDGNLTLTVDLELNNLTLTSGILNLSGKRLIVGGSIDANMGSITATTGTVIFNGSGTQQIGEGVFTDDKVANLTVDSNTTVVLEGTTRLTNLLSVNQGTFNANGFLVCESTSIVGPVSGSIVGEVTVERFIPAKRAFRFLSSAVNTTTSIYENWQEGGSNAAGFGTHITGSSSGANGFDQTPSGAASMFQFNNSTNIWGGIANTNATNLNAGDAYRVLVRGDRTINVASNSATPTNTILRTRGTLKTGTHTITDLNSTAGEYNLIGNPYQAPVNMQTVLTNATNIFSFFVFVWDPTRNTRGAYVTVNPINNTNNFAGSTANRYLQAGQSCFVISSGASPSITFQESYKYTVTTNQNMFRSAEETAPKSLRLTLFAANAYNANQSAADGALVFFDDSFDNEVNFMDAPKLANIDEDFVIKVNDQSLSIESKKLPLNQEEIQLSISKYRHNAYTMVVNMDEIQGTTAFLHDNFTNQYQMIPSGSDQVYNFTVDTNVPASIASDRFKVVFQVEALSNPTFEQGQVKLFPNPSNGDFYLSLPTHQKSEINIKNLLGQSVYHAVSNGQMSVQVNASSVVTSGLYLVDVMLDGQTYTQKIIIN